MRVLYHLPLSPYSRKVRLVLAEKRLPFDLKTEKVWERQPAYLELNPACTVPTLVEDTGLVIPDSRVICEYLEEAYPDVCLLPRNSMAERVETRRLVAWFDEKFWDEVARNLLWEKTLKQMLKLGSPDANALRAGYANLKQHLQYIGWLAEHRSWLAGSNLTIADFAAAAMLSSLDFLGDVDWSASAAAKDWYARIKSRPSFRAILAERVNGMVPPPHYADLDF
jgi:glutathione S-transferase